MSQPITYCLDGFPMRFPLVARLIGPLIRGRMFRTRRIPEGVRGPGELSTPAAVSDDEGIRIPFDTIDRFDQHTDPFVRHPMFGHMTCQQWIDFHLIHAAHHLACLSPAKGQAAA